ncbi:MAG: hypothetical protein RLZZ15_610 [Verrucomicrobiota bacterium]
MAFALSQMLFAQTPAAPKPTAAAEAVAVELSPFVVDSSADKGYLATQTLNGTRLKTDIKDIGSAMTIFTEQMMDDLGATSINDLMAFAPNTDPFVAATGDTTGGGNDFINVGNQQFVTRGGSTSTVSQDFFGTNIPNDRFNTESLTFTRGPNSILFGLGNAAGAFVSSTKRGKTNKTATTVTYQIDQRGTFRGTLDHNQVVKPGVLALRYSGLYETQHTFRPPTENFQRRHFLTTTFTPFKKTTLRANFEKGLINVPAVRPWPVYDAVTPWIAAGRPIIQTFSNTTTGKPAGTVNYTTNGLVSTQFSRAGTRLPTQSLNNTGQTVKPSFANGYVVNGTNLLSLVNDSIYPTFASNFGNTALRLHNYKTYSVFLEQEVTRDFFFEIAYNKLDNRLIALNGLVGQNDFLYADPNAQLPNGQPNPNVGLYYVEAGTTRIDNPNQAENVRVTASYNLDFTRSKHRWLAALGRHQLAVFNEQSHTSDWSSNNRLNNTTPLATTGAATAISNAANQLIFRHYVDPAKGVIGTAAGGEYLKFPVLYRGATPPPGAGTGVITPGFLSQQGLNMSEAIIKTWAVATQSFFWKDRIVVTSGLRQDASTTWSGIATDFNALTDANGFRPSGDQVDLRKYLPNSRRTRSGHTATRGVVFHARPWLSFSYNASNNLNINDSTINRYGNLLPNPSGEGRDYGVKMEFFERRLFLDAVYYTNSNQNAAELIASGTWGDFNQVGAIFNAVQTFTGDPKYDLPPYQITRVNWFDNVSRTSKGWELSLTARPTKNWRMVLNGSQRGKQTATDRGVFITQFLAEYLPIIKSHPEWQNLNVGGVTVARAVTDLETTLANFQKLESSPNSHFAASWTLNTVQSYDFDGVLKGFSAGATMNARGKAIAGFQVDDRPVNPLIVPSKPYYAPAYANYGARLTYRRKVFQNRLDWTLQLNVKNVLDENTIYPLHIVDRRDGTHRPSTAIYTLREPRTYQFTSTFRF